MCLSRVQFWDLEKVLQGFPVDQGADPDENVEAGVKQENAVGRQLLVGQLEHVWHLDDILMMCLIPTVMLMLTSARRF